MRGPSCVSSYTFDFGDSRDKTKSGSKIDRRGRFCITPDLHHFLTATLYCPTNKTGVVVDDDDDDFALDETNNRAVVSARDAVSRHCRKPRKEKKRNEQ
jgi:hypothetical protein